MKKLVAMRLDIELWNEFDSIIDRLKTLGIIDYKTTRPKVIRSYIRTYIERGKERIRDYKAVESIITIDKGEGNKND